MSRISLATPCPAPRAASGHPPFPKHINQVSANGSNLLEDETCATTDLDYTRAIQQEFKNARPRRRADFPRKDGRNMPVSVFEDVLEEEGEKEVLGGELKKQPVGGNGRTLLSRPAQKMPIRLGKKVESVVEGRALGEIGQGRARMTNAGVQKTAAQSLEGDMRQRREVTKKEERRRTIFVPDDTTVLTIHPGASDTRRLDDTFHHDHDMFSKPFVSDAEAALSTQTKPEKAVRRPRASLAVAPKRVPLQHMMAKQGNVPAVDVVGQNGGKENMPPGGKDVVCDESKPGKAVVSLGHIKNSPLHLRLSKPTAVSQDRRMAHNSDGKLMRDQSLPENGRDSRAIVPARMVVAKRLSSSPREIVHPQQLANRNLPRRVALRERESISTRPVASINKRQTPPQKSVLAPIRNTSKVSQYPVLAEDVAQPQLYEASWLSQQEIALTELVNEIFETTRNTTRDSEFAGKRLRESLIEIYHQPSVTTLYQRLQASLSYGALSRPRDLPSSPHPAHDLGMRKRFLGLWLDTYDETALRAAVEVVVGRQLSGSTDSLRNSLEASERVLDPAKSRRALVAFLETFFISVEDLEDAGVEHPLPAEDMSGRRWRKTVLRSLMLIWLLDQAKASAAIDGCLFKRTSPLKSSTSVLRALSGMLIPSVGDVSRALRHIDYTVGHVQDPLDEVRYRIDNVAVDLRDGVFLTRLVEVLIFSPGRQRQESGGEGTVTIKLPDETILESAFDIYNGSRVLSQHLKMPCLSRVQKIHNVQVALGALQGYGGAANGAFHDVTADDIVDGHRERTLALLWSLVSHHGLNRLVDWVELENDIQRSTGQDHTPTNPSTLSQSAREDLLQAWATAHCAKTGLHITNLTTAFADKKAYTAILNAYKDFLPSDRDHTSTSLESRLQALGCSAAFARQFIVSNSIPGRTTTISNLAFLASRLLPLTRRHNAAVRVQRWVRCRRNRVLISQRIRLMRVAHACTTVVQTREGLIKAAVVVQRAWRAVVDRRVEMLGQNVQGFQAVARGWMVRRRSKGKDGERGSQSLRVMGGW